MSSSAALLLVLPALLGFQDPPEPAEKKPPTPELGVLNKHILESLRAYPTDGSYRYWWPKKGGWAGNTKDLHYKGELLAKGDPKRRSYCCGLTFEVFLDAWQAWCTTKETPYAIPGMADAKALRELRKQWFGSDGNRKTMLNALVQAKLGTHIRDPKKARAGDFLQLWRHGGSGHSVVFLSWKKDEEGAIVGVRYWSTQKSTDGIGEREEKIGKGDKDVDAAQLYLVRVGVNPEQRR